MGLDNHNSGTPPSEFLLQIRLKLPKKPEYQEVKILTLATRFHMTPEMTFME